MLPPCARKSLRRKAASLGSNLTVKMNRGSLHYSRGSWGLRSSMVSRIFQWEKLPGHLAKGPNPQVMTAVTSGTVLPFANSVLKIAAGGPATNLAYKVFCGKNENKVYCLQQQILIAVVLAILIGVILRGCLRGAEPADGLNEPFVDLEAADESPQAEVELIGSLEHHLDGQAGRTGQTVGTAVGAAMVGCARRLTSTPPTPVSSSACTAPLESLDMD